MGIVGGVSITATCDGMRSREGSRLDDGGAGSILMPGGDASGGATIVDGENEGITRAVRRCGAEARRGSGERESGGRRWITVASAAWIRTGAGATRRSAAGPQSIATTHPARAIHA